MAYILNYSSDLGGTDVGSHPWQRRIQGLKDAKAGSGENPSVQMGPTQQVIVSTDTAHIDNQTDMNLANLPVNNASLYPLPQGLDFDFSQRSSVPFTDGLVLSPNGWGEAQVIPGLANFGMMGGWVADGLEDDLRSFSHMDGP